MAAPEHIKTYQRRLAQLNTAYQRAQHRLADQQQKRTTLIVAQDQLVSAAQLAVEEAVAKMASEIGPELAAHLTGSHVRDVRRILKRTVAAEPGGPGVETEVRS